MTISFITSYEVSGGKAGVGGEQSRNVTECGSGFLKVVGKGVSYRQLIHYTDKGSYISYIIYNFRTYHPASIGM